jgi:hypothetical protein
VARVFCAQPTELTAHYPLPPAAGPALPPGASAWDPPSLPPSGDGTLPCVFPIPCSAFHPSLPFTPLAAPCPICRLCLCFCLVPFPLAALLLPGPFPCPPSSGFAPCFCLVPWLSSFVRP